MCSHSCCHGIHYLHDGPKRQVEDHRDALNQHKEGPTKDSFRTGHGSQNRDSPKEREIKSVKVKINGRVQGVHYRKWTVETANTMHLDGWVRNCKDGTVEATFSGKLAAVNRMLEKCQIGSSRARVSNIDVKACEEPRTKGFEQIADAW